MPTDTVQAYRSALKQFQKHEAALQKAMQALDAARELGDPSRITPARIAARAAEVAAEEAWLDLTSATRAYWKQRAQAMLRQIEELAPLVAEYEACVRAGGDYRSYAGIEQIRAALRPWVLQPDSEVPLRLPESDVLQAAGRDHGIW